MFDKKITIFGGCATRDVFELDNIKSNKISVFDYYSRSSLASAMSKNIPSDLELDYLKIKSPFQRRCVERDIEKTFLKSLSSEVFDYLILDFLSIRFDLAECDGNLVTVSSGIKEAGFDLNKSSYRLIKKNAEEYRFLWKTALLKLLDGIDVDKIIVNKIYLAKVLQDGSEFFEGSKNKFISESNIFLEFAYSECEKYIPSKNFIEYDNDCFVGALEHKWGVGPYHFTNDLYKTASQYLIDLYD